MNTTKVVPLRAIAAKPKAAAPSSHPKAPPGHLHPAAKRAWIDIVTCRPGLPQADSAMIERAAVLVAHFRDFGMNKSLVALMNSILTELHISPLARARVRDRAVVLQR